jgi:hypothetical protein
VYFILNKEKDMKTKLTEAQQIFIVVEYSNGKTLGDISKALRKDRITIRRFLEFKEIPIRKTGEARKGRVRLNIKDELKDTLIKEYSEGISGHEVAKKYGLSFNTLYRRFRRWGIKVKDASEAARIYPVKEESYFDVIDTEDKAYLLGLLYADGCNTCGRIILGLQEADKHILDYYNDIIQPGKPLEYVPNNKKNPLWKDMYRLAIHDKHINQTLNEWGIVPKKTFGLTFPDRLNPELYRHFIRGYFDGDGCVMLRDAPYFNLRITMISSSTPFITKIAAILSEHVIVNHVRSKYNSFELLIDGNNNARRMLEYMYKDAHIYFHRKFNKAVEYLKGADTKELTNNQFSERYPFTSEDLDKCTSNYIAIRPESTYSI